MDDVTGTIEANVAATLERAGETPEDAKRMARESVEAYKKCPGCLAGNLVPFDYRGLPMARCATCGLEVNDATVEKWPSLDALHVHDPFSAVAAGTALASSVAMPVAAQRITAFEIGWRMAAEWAKRDDLNADMDSPAYIAERCAALASVFNIIDGEEKGEDREQK